MEWARHVAAFRTGTCTESKVSLDIHVQPLLFVIRASCAATCSSSRGKSRGACMSVGLAGRHRTTWW
eukprot:2633699-Pyramimonas_sp.AAC.1